VRDLATVQEENADHEFPAIAVAAIGRMSTS
jgi:hypothetical protein